MEMWEKMCKFKNDSAIALEIGLILKKMLEKNNDEIKEKVINCVKELKTMKDENIKRFFPIYEGIDVQVNDPSLPKQTNELSNALNYYNVATTSQVKLHLLNIIERILDENKGLFHTLNDEHISKILSKLFKDVGKNEVVTNKIIDIIGILGIIPPLITLQAIISVCPKVIDVPLAIPSLIIT